MSTSTSLRRRRPPRSAVPLLLFLVLAGCSSKQRLGEYEFRGRTLGLVTFGPAYPEVFGGLSLKVDPDNPVEALARIGSEAAREVQVQRARPRLHEAASRVDVRGRIGERTLQHGARHLRATPVSGSHDVDYELEIRIRRYGVVAASWTSPAYFLVDAEMTLLDGGSGRRIWRTRFQERDPVQPFAISGDRNITNIVTAAALANMSAEEMERTLELMADHAADHMVARLRRGLDAARN